jgi:hypothetical protein
MRPDTWKAMTNSQKFEWLVKRFELVEQRYPEAKERAGALDINTPWTMPPKR